MAINRLEVKNYRSIRDIQLKLGQLNVIVGENGCGKSNLYRSMYLVACAATGAFAHTLAEEGGMASVLWAGRWAKNELRQIHLMVELDELEYEIDCGRIPMEPPGHPDSLANWFRNDPDIKREEVKLKYRDKLTSLLKREGGVISARDMDGRAVQYPLSLTESESVLSGLREPHKFPELSQLRQELLNWRFYHHFRTDTESPLRRPQLGVITPVLSHDGTDVAAALATICGIGDSAELRTFFAEAFPGAHLILESEDGQMVMKVQMPSFFRPFDAVELSDGTLQYLCLLAALLTPRPPSVMALNEPETSIHPDLLGPLAKLLIRASKRSQMWITTHSRDLVHLLSKYAAVQPIELLKLPNGETVIAGSERATREQDPDDDDNDDDDEKNDEDGGDEIDDDDDDDES